MVDDLARWTVCCDDPAVSPHFFERAAVADALRRAGVGGRVSLQDGDGRVVGTSELPRFGTAPTPAATV
jgi:hypothetical protein